jgi:hypothetical protein
MMCGWLSVVSAWISLGTLVNAPQKSGDRESNPADATRMNTMVEHEGSE